MALSILYYGTHKLSGSYIPCCRYYDAYRALSDADPPFTDLCDAEAVARHEPKLATDPTLTAF